MADPVRTIQSVDVVVGNPTKASEVNKLIADMKVALTETDKGTTAATPSTPVESQIYFDTDLDTFMLCIVAGSFGARIGNQLHIPSPGPSAIGGTIQGNRGLSLDGAFVSDGASDASARFVVAGSITGAPGDTTRLANMVVAGSIITQTAGETITDVVGYFISAPAITDNLTGGGVILNASTLKVGGAPTEGVNNRSFWVGAGLSLFDGRLELGLAAPTAPDINSVYSDSICKAWVNISVVSGTVTIRDDYNVSSITDNGVGDYTVVLDTDLPDTDYSVSGIAQRLSATAGGANVRIIQQAHTPAPSVGSFDIAVTDTVNALADAVIVSVHVFGGV